jgi:hypothetical protein
MALYPFLFMHAEAPPDLDAADRVNIREYLLRGGFLFAEDCVDDKGLKIGGHASGGHTSDKFFLRMAEELPLILPEATFERLPLDHPIFNCYYHLSGGIPHMQGTAHGLHGVTYNGRLVAVLSPSDIHCGWTGYFSEYQRRAALKMGTNIYLYAMTQGTGGKIGSSPGPQTQ